MSQSAASNSLTAFQSEEVMNPGSGPVMHAPRSISWHPKSGLNQRLGPALGAFRGVLGRAAQFTHRRRLKQAAALRQGKINYPSRSVNSLL